MKIAALISGGKDSIYAAFKASKQNEIDCLISLKSKRDDSYMFHIPNIDLVKLQAKAMKIIKLLDIKKIILMTRK